MKVFNNRATSPKLLAGLVFLLAISNSRAVDPVDFLESLKDDSDLSPSGGDSSSTEYPNGVNVIPGEAEVNYPVYSSIPKSSFSCIGRPVGFYADTELRCQVWHICDEDRRQQSFLCTNGTVYSQEKRVCDWWYNVNCDPSEVSKNYLQNYDLYKGPPPKSENAEETQEKNSHNKNNDYNSNSNKNINEFDYQPTTKSANRGDPFSRQPSPSESQRQPQRYTNNNNNDQYSSKPTEPSYNEPSSNSNNRGESSFSNNNNNFQQSSQRRQQQQPTTRQQTTTTTYRPPTTYTTPPPPAALQGSSFPPQRHHQSHHQPSASSQQPQQKQSSFTPTTTTPAPSRSVPSQKTYNQNGKRIVEIRVPVSQIPPEILAKYGKRIPEHILKEIFLNFTRGQQQQLQKEAITNANPTGAGNNRSSPPSAPIPQNNRQSSQPPQPNHSSHSKKPIDLGTLSNDYKPSFASQSQSKPNPPPQSQSKSNNSPPPPPPPPPPQEPQQKFRHSTPRKVDNVKFATPTRELLADYDDERQLVGESQNPVYSLQQLFSSHHSRTSQKSRGSSAPANEVPRVKDSFTFEPTTTTTTTSQPFQQQQPFQQEFTRSQPRRRTQSPSTTPYRSTTTATTTTTTEEPALITDRYVPVKTKEEKKNAEQVRRILLVARQGIQVLPPIPFLSSGSSASQQEPLHPTPRRVPPTTQRPQGRRTTPFQEFSKIPPPPKVAIPDDYYVKNERFQEAESRYPTPKVPTPYIEPYQRPTTSTTTTTTTTTTTQAPPPPPTPFFQEPEFRRTKPSKPQHQHKKKALPPPAEPKKSDSDYDNGDENDDGSPREQFNTDELELLRLAQEYIDLTGQDFGVRKQPKNA